MTWKPRLVPGGRDAGAPPTPEAPAPSECSDADLAERIVRALAQGEVAAGDSVPGQAAFTELIQRHEGRVLRLAWHLSGNREDARDIAQDAFLRAWRSLGTFRPDHSFRAWLVRIVVNAAHDHRARRRPWLFVPAGEAADMPASGDPEAVAEAALFAVRLHRAAAALAPREREVFVLRDIEGLDVEEIASLLRIAPPTVRRHLALARLRLRRELGPPGGADDEL